MKKESLVDEEKILRIIVRRLKNPIDPKHGGKETFHTIFVREGTIMLEYTIKICCWSFVLYYFDANKMSARDYLRLIHYHKHNCFFIGLDERERQSAIGYSPKFDCWKRFLVDTLLFLRTLAAFEHENPDSMWKITGV